jgi:hypothetical protein
MPQPDRGSADSHLSSAEGSEMPYQLDLQMVAVSKPPFSARSMRKEWE